MDIFEYASKHKLRFSSVAGLLITEQLWDLPLTAKNGMSLNQVAINTNKQLKELGEENFVSSTPDARKKPLEVSLEILKHIIAVRQDEANAAKERAEKTARRTKLIAALERKDAESIDGMTKEQIEKELAES